MPRTKAPVEMRGTAQGTPVALEVDFVSSEDHIQIGCQHFSGRNAKRLRRWALGEK